MITETLDNPNVKERRKERKIFRILFFMFMFVYIDEEYKNRSLEDKCVLVIGHIDDSIIYGLDWLKGELQHENILLGKINSELKLPFSITQADWKQLKKYTCEDLVNLYEETIEYGYLIAYKTFPMLIPFSIIYVTKTLSMYLEEHKSQYITLDQIALIFEASGMIKYIYDQCEKVNDNRDKNFIASNALINAIEILRRGKAETSRVILEKINDQKFKVINKHTKELFQNTNTAYKSNPSNIASSFRVQQEKEAIKNYKRTCTAMFFIGLFLDIIGSILIANSTSLGAGIALLVIGVIIGVLGAIGSFLLSGYKTK